MRRNGGQLTRHAVGGGTSQTQPLPRHAERAPSASAARGGGNQIVASGLPWHAGNEAIPSAARDRPSDVKS